MKLHVGRKIYFDNRTGEFLVDTGQQSGAVQARTQEEDFATYKALAERVPETVGMIQLEFDQYKQDFAEGILDHVDPETKQLYFRYPDPSNPEPEPRPPLSVEVDSLKQADIENKQAIAELTMMIAAPMV